ncbi:MAG: ATP-dependent DNA helicase [Actinomycetota bacterium]
MSQRMPLVDEAVEALTHVTAALPSGGEERSGQVEMLRAVATAIDEQEHLVVQAGTGTGKSLAYLVPVVLSRKRTVIATATKALQDQIAAFELPHLARQVERPFTFAVLKGRNNYICRQRVNEYSNDAQLSLAGTAAHDEDELDRLVEFSDESMSGDRAELDFEPSESSWAAMSVTSRECPGRNRCPSGENCFAEMARDRAAESDVIVVNTHLLGMNLLSDGAVLPDHQIVVIDEAHQLEDIASSTFSWTIGGARFRWFARTTDRILDDRETIDRLRDIGDDITDVLEPLEGKRLDPDDSDELMTVLDRALDRVNETIEAVRKLPSGKNSDADARANRAIKAGTTLMEELVGSRSLSDQNVAWVEHNNGEPTLQVAPLDVSAMLGPLLFDHEVEGDDAEDTQDPDISEPAAMPDTGAAASQPRTVILTSATLAPTIGVSVGLREDDFTRVDVDSPFDYPGNALLYCATSLPEPRADAYESAMLDHLTGLIEAAGGRTLGLFTSWRMMDIAAEHLDATLDTPVVTQRDLPKPALIELFRDSPSTTLLATLGFWQGIDIPGPSLTLVTIDRLPFPRPDDPLLSARRDLAGRHAFRTIDLPRAATLLAQGAGRLIRSTTDEGVVAILDSRLATKKSYRWDLIKAMPDFTRTSDVEVVKTRLRELDQRAASAS